MDLPDTHDTCINCIRTFPTLRAWHEKYADKGLIIIGVHSPEFEFEKNPENVRKAIEDYGLQYPIVQDNDYATWRAYRNRYWPAHYFIDKNGHIRRTHFGEGAYDESEEAIQALLEEIGQDVGGMPTEEQNYTIDSRTPELYLGYDRSEFFASPERTLRDAKRAYSIPSDVPLHHFAFQGEWVVSGEQVSPAAGARLKLHFEAKQVFLVMKPEADAPSRVRVMLDGKGITESDVGQDMREGIVTVDSDQLYSLVKLRDPGRHILTLEFLDGNVELFAFTFG